MNKQIKRLHDIAAVMMHPFPKWERESEALMAACRSGNEVLIERAAAQAEAVATPYIAGLIRAACGDRKVAA
jgi:hypothetical protein